MNAIKTTMYNLPSLKFLQKKKLIATALYVFVFYLVCIAFSVSTIDTYFNHQGYYYPDETYVAVATLFILAGVGVLFQFRRLILALTARHLAFRAGTTIANYEIDISPVEASVLIDARDDGELAYLLVGSLQKKARISAWRTGDGVIHIQSLDTFANLTYYEQVFTSELFKQSNSIVFTDSRLKSCRALTTTQEAIYQHMVDIGYFSKMKWWQEFLYYYAHITSLLASFVAYPLVLILTCVQFFGPITQGPIDILPNSNNQQVLFALTGLVLLLIVPVLMYLAATYSQKGSEAFRQVFGLYWFLKSAYGHRLSRRDFLSESERNKYLPYAEAFGLVKPSA